MTSSPYESPFVQYQTNPNIFLFPPPPLFYPPYLFFHNDSSFHLYHETFIRTLLNQQSRIQQTHNNHIPTTITTTTNESCSESSTELLTHKKQVSLSNVSKIRRRLLCPQCSYTTNRLNNLKRHVQTMHEILADPIDCCDRLFTSKAHFRAHVNTDHRRGYHCDICRRTFCRKALLRRHQSVHSGEKAFVCQVCAYSTSHKGNLDRHTRVHRQPHREV